MDGASWRCPTTTTRRLTDTAAFRRAQTGSRQNERRWAPKAIPYGGASHADIRAAVMLTSCSAYITLWDVLATSQHISLKQCHAHTAACRACTRACLPHCRSPSAPSLQPRPLNSPPRSCPNVSGRYSQTQLCNCNASTPRCQFCHLRHVGGAPMVSCNQSSNQCNSIKKHGMMYACVFSSEGSTGSERLSALLPEVLREVVQAGRQARACRL